MFVSEREAFPIGEGSFGISQQGHGKRGWYHGGPWGNLIPFLC